MEKRSELLNRFVGEWIGSCRTWFEPGKLADESPIAGKFGWFLNDNFLRHEYSGSIMSDPRKGEETFVYNEAKKKIEVIWIDTFHMAGGIMHSEGFETSDGIEVLGHYDTAPGEPRWGWRTQYTLLGEDDLKIESYNVTPNGESAKAVEVVYKRIR